MTESIHPKLLTLADLLDRTAMEWDQSLMLLADSIHPSARETVLLQRKITSQLHVTAERIREGRYSE